MPSGDIVRICVGKIDITEKTVDYCGIRVVIWHQGFLRRGDQILSW